MFRLVQVANRRSYLFIIIQDYSNLWQPLCYLFYAKKYLLFLNLVASTNIWHDLYLSLIRKKATIEALETIFPGGFLSNGYTLYRSSKSF